MKHIKHLLLLLLVLTLVGCKPDPLPEKLSTPSNVLFEELLTWDEVEHATGYDVYINNTPHHSDQNYYVISEEGTYELQIVAKAPGYEHSEASVAFTLILDYQNEINPVLNVSGNSVTWASIEGAVSYNLVINGVTTNTPVTGVVLVAPGIFEVSVQAVYPIGTSNLSESTIVALELETVATMQFQYSSNSTDDIFLFDEMFLGDVYIEDSQGNIMDSNGALTYSNVYRAISSAFIKVQAVDVIEFYILVGIKRIPVEITLSSKETPYIISSSIITSDGTEDIKLQFELFEGEIYSINGTSEDTILYSVEESVLTIEKEFITQKFNSSEAFMLSYVLNLGEDSVIGYLHLNKTNNN